MKSASSKRPESKRPEPQAVPWLIVLGCAVAIGLVLH
jgi:hypothetical protein